MSLLVYRQKISFSRIILSHLVIPINELLAGLGKISLFFEIQDALHKDAKRALKNPWMLFNAAESDHVIQQITNLILTKIFPTKWLDKSRYRDKY